MGRHLKDVQRQVGTQPVLKLNSSTRPVSALLVGLKSSPAGRQQAMQRAINITQSSSARSLGKWRQETRIPHRERSVCLGQKPPVCASQPITVTVVTIPLLERGRSLGNRDLVHSGTREFVMFLSSATSATISSKVTHKSGHGGGVAVLFPSSPTTPFQKAM